MITAVRTQENSLAKWLPIGLLGVIMVGVSFSTVHAPFLITGAVLGAAVLAIALTAPMALVALLLVTGPVDLSFLTGGFKSLFPNMGGLDMNGIRLLGATAGFFVYILFQPRSRAAILGPLGRVWVVFLLFAGATLMTSLDRLEGVRLLLKLAYPLLTFLIVLGVADTRERAALLMKYTLVAALLLTVIVSPLLALNGGYVYEQGVFLRVQGLKGHNPFAFYVTAMLMIVFARFVLRMQLRYLLFALVLLAWIAMTGTRIAALAAVIGMALIGLLNAAASQSRKVLIGALCVAAAAGAVMLPAVLMRSFGYVPGPGELLRLASNPVALYESINWNGRELLWAILWGAFSASPILGLGLGSSAAVIRETFPGGIRVAHNEYMRLATDTGVLGMVLFAAAVVVWLIAALRMSRRGDRSVREFAFAAAAAIVAWGVIAITDNAFDYYTDFTQYVGFLMAGAVVMQSTNKAVAGEGAIGDH